MNNETDDKPQGLSLGSYDSKEAAARAYDNAAFYINKLGIGSRKELNFPEEYEGDSPPRPFHTTTTALLLLGAGVRFCKLYLN